MPSCGLETENRAGNRIYVAIGGNQAYRRRTPLENLGEALNRLQARGVEIMACSRPWRTPAWPDPSDPPYVNGVVEIACDLSPLALMETLHGVEAELGRTRRRRNAPRPIDLDLIDYRGRVAMEASPILPHPRMAERAFVLLPLRDIAPHWRHPVTGRSLDQLIARLPAADRRAARPHGGALCAAPSRLKARPC